MAGLNETERHRFIRTFFKLRDLSFAELAREHAVAASTVSSIAAGRGRSERLECAIASAIGLSHAELWPERQSNKLSERRAR